MSSIQRQFKSKVRTSVVFTFSILLFLGLLSLSSVIGQETEPSRSMNAEEAGVAKFGLIAAAAAFGLGAMGAGYAISHVGAAAMGAIGERPEIASQALIFIALAEGLVVFGFITAILILGKI